MFKLTLSAGHGIDTPGKQSIQSPPVKEWIYNQMVVVALMRYFEDYEIEVKRIDRPTGQDTALPLRSGTVNAYKPDLHLDIHHNAGARPNQGTGTSVYRQHKINNGLADKLSKAISTSIGLTNRGAKTKVDNGVDWFHVLREIKCESYLVECAFQDTWTDLGKMVKPEYAGTVAKAIGDTLVSHFNIKRKQTDSYKMVYKMPGNGKYKFTITGNTGQELYVKQ